jgi:hypothetical protein
MTYPISEIIQESQIIAVNNTEGYIHGSITPPGSE